jgi:hypothetical protein
LDVQIETIGLLFGLRGDAVHSLEVAQAGLSLQARSSFFETLKLSTEASQRKLEADNAWVTEKVREIEGLLDQRATIKDTPSSPDQSTALESIEGSIITKWQALEQQQTIKLEAIKACLGLDGYLEKLKEAVPYIKIQQEVAQPKEVETIPRASLSEIGDELYEAGHGIALSISHTSHELWEFTQASWHKLWHPEEGTDSNA